MADENSFEKELAAADDETPPPKPAEPVFDTPKPDVATATTTVEPIATDMKTGMAAYKKVLDSPP